MRAIPDRLRDVSCVCAIQIDITFLHNFTLISGQSGSIAKTSVKRSIIMAFVAVQPALWSNSVCQVFGEGHADHQVQHRQAGPHV